MGDTPLSIAPVELIEMLALGCGPAVIDALDAECRRRIADGAGL